MNYRIPKEVRTELKISKALYLLDFFMGIGLLAVTLILKRFVHPSLEYYFYGFMMIVGLIMIWRPMTNPQKRMYEVLLITLSRRKSTYCASDTDR